MAPWPPPLWIRPCMQVCDTVSVLMCIISASAWVYLCVCMCINACVHTYI